MMKYLLSFLLFASLLQAATITTQQDNYNAQQAIVVSLTDMSGATNDWVGIYPAGASNAWGNVVSWRYTNGIVNGNLTLTGIPAGNYEARAFFRNSYNLESSASFTVGGAVVDTSISTQKASYTPNEAIIVTLSQMSGANNDWVGIYPAGASNAWGNVVSWRYTNGIVNGNLTLTGIAAGNYEARAFFRNSYTLAASTNFSVALNELPPTIYEDFESGNMNKWTISHDGGRADRAPSMNTAAGFDGSQYSGAFVNSAIGSQNTYRLAMENDQQFILEVDIYAGPIISHGMMGLRIDTDRGPRLIYWDAYRNYLHYHDRNNGTRPGIKYYGNNYAIIALGNPAEGTEVNNIAHFRVDVEEQLQIFEPGNHVRKIWYYDHGNGNHIDNIKLSSH